jgi:AcrR family transcriptional regulator
MDNVFMSDSPVADKPGLRERKKARTKAAIQEAALRLFGAQGYENTTVEQIAEAAEVSPSTFFRYFGSKEDVVIYDALDPLIIEAYRRQPPGVTALEAMQQAMHEVWGALSPAEVDEQLERGRLAYEVPALRERYVLELVRTVGMMGELVAERLGRPADDFEIRVVTGATMGGLLSAMLPTLYAGERDTDLVGLVDRAVEILKRGVAL